MLLFALVVAAGCLSGPAAPTPTETRSGPTATPAAPADATAANTVSVSNMTDAAEAAFREARNGTARFGPRCADTYGYDTLDPFREYSYAVDDGVYYRLTATTGTQTYYSRSYEPVAVNATDAAETVRFEELTGENRTVAENLLAGQYETSYCDFGEPAAVLSGDVAIRYRNETYVARTTEIADLPEWELTATRVETAGE